MNTLSRKQREIAQREEQILDVARKMLAEGGYLGLGMDRIAAAMEYSKGTIYQHFSCKEEVIIALANQAQEKRVGMFQRAAQFRGGSRERLAALGRAAELFVERYPDYFQVEQIVRLSSIWEKISEDRRACMRTCEQRCVETVSGIVRDGLASGDLALPEGVSPEDLVFGLWSINFGAFSILSTSTSLAEIGIRDPLEALRMDISMMLDGYGWKPLSHEHDYHETLERIDREVFGHEYEQSEIAVAG